jgi:CheY-like chemotaxis protein
LRDVPDFHPDVILLDYLMPGMDGFQTLDALAQRMDLSQIKVVMISGAELSQAQCRSHAAEFLPKPIDTRRLGQMLDTLCSH